MADLSQQQILITGATGGIGAATARLCVKQGASVWLAGRDQSKLAELQSELGGQAQTLCYDVTDEAAVKQIFSQLQKVGLDGLVNAAGVMTDAALVMTRAQLLRELFEINAVASFIHLQLASRLMMRNKKGSIVNLASLVGQQGSSGQAAYAMSKAAVSALTQSAAKELASTGVRVNAVAPGFIDTQMTEDYQDNKRQRVISQIGLGRAGKPEEVAQLIVFLLSEQASYMTGQVVAVDGAMRL